MIGVGLTPMETRRDVVLHVAERAEELGYDAFFLAEGWGHDVGVLLAEVARRTTRMELGTGVVNVWGRSPAGLAMLAASLGEASDGRFTLGLGTGSPALAEGLHGVPFDAPVQRLAAVAGEVRRLLDGERAQTGASGLRLAVRSPSSVPLLLAALGPESVRLAGAVADTWYPFLYPRSGLAAGLRTLGEGVAQAGRAAGCVRVAPCLPLAVADDPRAARELAAWWIGFYLTAMGPLYRRTLARLGFAAAVDAVVCAGGRGPLPAGAECLRDELLVWGAPEPARRLLETWCAAGADLPVLCLPPGRPVAELDAMLTAMAPLADPRRLALAGAEC